MAIQKFIDVKTSPMGENPVETSRIHLNVLEDSSNYLIHRDILRQQISKKQGTVSTKTRSEVRGGGKKPWRQKGTGRARAGSSRSPLWKGGGVIFGPKPKTVRLKMNKKERNLALQTLLYNKRNIMTEIANIESLKPKTKDFSTLCQQQNINLNEKLLLIVSEKTSAIKLATQNLKNVELISVSHLNTLSLLKAKQILLTSSALKNLKEIYSEREARQ
jgi:large subunit ribosomal protein L4